MKRREKTKCPECGAVAVVPIAYGHPVVETFEAADRGEVMLGGCCVTDHDPQWGCTACKARFFSEGDGRTLTLAEDDPLPRYSSR